MDNLFQNKINNMITTEAEMIKSINQSELIIEITFIITIVNVAII